MTFHAIEKIQGALSDYVLIEYEPPDKNCRTNEAGDCIGGLAAGLGPCMHDTTSAGTVRDTVDFFCNIEPGTVWTEHHWRRAMQLKMDLGWMK